jgi:hypothetical protein
MTQNVPIIHIRWEFSVSISMEIFPLNGKFSKNVLLAW